MKGTTLISIAVMSIFYISCNAAPKDGIRDYILSQKDNGYGKVMKDSISDIILNSKKITCELKSQNPTDSLRKDTLCVLSKSMTNIFHYLFFNEENFKGNKVVYGHFIPWVSFTIKSKNKKVVYLEFDFSLSKWRILDSKKKELYIRDMYECNSEMIRFVRLLFPKDITLKTLNDNLKTIKDEKNSIPIQLPVCNSNN